MAAPSYQALSVDAVDGETWIVQTQNDNLADRQPVNEVPSDKKLSSFDAFIHLVKGNLGPGCLNLPHAFSLAGWALGSILFVIIALQGIYSMCLLLYCKNLLNQRNNDNNVKSFMDVSRAALGFYGGRIVEILLFVLQSGVCCVFLSLVSTNLVAAVPGLSVVACVGLVTLLFMAMVLLRFLKDLIWLCATANAFMIVAVMTATVAGLWNYVEQQPANIVAANPTSSAVITFTCDMFFAFEGIGLVLPVENSCNLPQQSFPRILISSMSVVATLFLLIGISGSIGFPSIRSGSVTAYLEREYPQLIWFSMVNCLVIVAVAFTFPLQLAPAMEVLDQWLDGTLEDPRVDSGASCGLDVTSSEEDFDRSSMQNLSPTQNVAIAQDELFPAQSSQHQQHCCNSHSWLLRRWGMVILCAMIVLLVNDLGVLMSLFGAVGQTGLAGMPCAVFLALQYQGIAPKNVLWSVLNMLILAFCFTVMVTGCFLVATELF
ncbi:amino acid transmembrane transporter [Fragilaria crotonensis]|nr:amino acid transmembrane transporter [Fragilaria crotonensis]